MASMEITFLLVSILAVLGAQGDLRYKELSVKMPGAAAKQNDDYLCTSVPVHADEEYIVSFEAEATEEVAHHMILSGCKIPGSRKKVWGCGLMGGLECASGQEILFAWAKNAPPKKLPKGVAFQIGKKFNINYLVLQVHYRHKAKVGQSDHSGFVLHTTTTRPHYIAGIYLLWSGDADIPPDTQEVHVDLACKYQDDHPIYAFAYRTHAHGLGRVISGYRVQDSKWSLLGKGDPQAPQAFYPIDHPVTISKGDTVAARCTFDSRGHKLDHHVHIGATGADEMCNFYLMYYRDASARPLRQDECNSNRLPPDSHFPKDSDKPLKPPVDTSDELTGSRKRVLEDVDVPEDDELVIKMPGAQPDEENDYLCTAVRIKEREKYIVHFEPQASSKVAHHMLLFGCDEPGSDQEIWKCREMSGRKCKGDYKVIYAWANDAPAKNLPQDVGFKIGKNTNIKYLVLQMHYKHKIQPGLKDNSGLVLKTTTKRQKNTAGVLVIWAEQASIPPDTNGFHVDVGCKYEEDFPIHPFAFRTHAHSLGRVVTGYQIHNKHWTLMGKGEPKAAQAFYPIMHPLTVSSGDLLVARCTYDTVGRDLKSPVGIGATGADEMCNFYVMFYRESKYEDRPIPKCTKNFHSKNFPPDSDTALVTSSSSEEEGSGMMDPAQENPLNKLRYHLVENWPLLGQETLGQVSAVALDMRGNVVVFHRGSRAWDLKSFDRDNVFQERTPIREHTVTTFDRKTGKIIGRWGRDRFYMPHGLTIDHEDNTWITDVALHQVHKYGTDGSSEPVLVLGEMLRPGSDDKHFCQPNDVAIETTGVFYVADGYCNSRVMKFSPEGKLLEQYGKAMSARGLGSPPPLGVFDVVHSLALDQTHHHLYVADRENGRVQRLDTKKGRFDREITNKEFGASVYAVDFNSHDGGVLHIVNGESVFGGKRIAVQGFTVRTSDGALLGKWPGQGNFFTQPHDIASSADNNELFVTQTGPNRVWKLTRVLPPLSNEKSQPSGHSESSQSVKTIGDHSRRFGNENDYTDSAGDRKASRFGAHNEASSSFDEKNKEDHSSRFHGKNDHEFSRKFGKGPWTEEDRQAEGSMKALPTLVSSEQDPCVLENATGPCRGAFPKWYYSTADNACHEFLYGGCGGNANKFDSKSECLEVCYRDERKHSKIPDDNLGKKNEDALKNLKIITTSNRPTADPSEITDGLSTQGTHDEWDLAQGEDEGPESNIHYNISDYPPYQPKNKGGVNGTASVHKLEHPTQSPDELAVGMIPALIILSVLAVPIVFLLLISIILRVRAYRRESRFHASRPLKGKEQERLGVSRTRGWCSYLNCCDKRKYGFDRVDLAEFYSDSDSEGV
ncbi:peptidyl-glycine alpha-amidating monooxygenase A [Nematostella vectensis]|uniref:peptidyl-glycine alpha-amidating monooxygenase A n=1 Tax=Nematostella vectensis TaxID=45351 RepID=UPI002077867D|nr:peptidyl-glycine alpha-amidating monooxygenase A [Nematostella vectensis]